MGKVFRDLATAASRGGVASAWATIGAIVGFSLGAILKCVFPGLPVTPIELSYISGGLFFALGILGVVPGLTSSRALELSKCLGSIDRLFLTGRITKAERRRLREKCLKKF